MNTKVNYTDKYGGSIVKIDTLVGICIQKGYVSQDEAPWLRYALERRIVFLIAFVVLLIIGLLITTTITLLAFFHYLLLAMIPNKRLSCKVCWWMYSLLYTGGNILFESSA